MQLIHEVEGVLRSANYRIARTPGARPLAAEQVLFEDDAVVGFVAVLPSVPDVLASWRHTQDEFLRAHAGSLRRDPLKAWTAYSVFLTAAPADDATTLLAIEADVAATRKIVRGGILTPIDVRSALAPLLPLPGGSATPNSVDSALSEKFSDDEAKLFELVREPAGAELRVVTWLSESAT